MCHLLQLNEKILKIDRPPRDGRSFSDCTCNLEITYVKSQKNGPILKS